MADYSFSDYSIFDDAISTTTTLSNSINEGKTKVANCQNKLNDDSVFMGPICESCVEGFNDVLSKIATMTDNYSVFSSYLAETQSDYKKGDSSGSNTVLTSGSGVANSLGATSGTLDNARIGDDGWPTAEGYYLRDINGGLNPFPLNGSEEDGGNCTFYAYARFSELTGEAANTLSMGDACSWWDDTYGYKKGQEPRLGAIAVWQYGDRTDRGHVAVVESIDENGNITTSEGGYGNMCWYTNEEYSSKNGYALDYNDGHLLGFIYPEKE